ncbi:unannotated protein [freshwater metagenome]|uniref:Unannotated protein n=1 Tax=freshwater metagenome TaxID=449393 RepID=A0A6J7SBW5_9ZZZZ
MGEILYDRDVQLGELVRLRASYCEACDRWEFPVRDYCPTCPAPVVVAALPGPARVVGFTAVMHAPPGSLVAVPYVLAVAAFLGGISIMGVVDNVELGDLEVGVLVDVIAAARGDIACYAYRLQQR